MVQVRVSEGVLEGEVVENKYGGSYCSFKGVPYAEPPVGELRFKAPQPKKPWSGVLSAKELGPICFQYDVMLKTPPSGSEDCLYLNVYTPDLKPSKPLPVMFWIHGGAFTCGSGNDNFYGPEFLVRHGVILVTINYRVEVLGFLCLNTQDIPGNAGMKDQVAAMRWVKKNIGSFGGDPENITIFGESAGAASVSYHLISPMTKGIFKRAICQSGTSLCWWAKDFAPRERAIMLAKQLGLQSEGDEELVEFFKSQPVEKLVSKIIPVSPFERTVVNKIYFSVVNEDKFGDNERFFYGDVADAVRSGIHEGVEVIVGYNEDEGLINLFSRDGEPVSQMIERANMGREFFVPEPIGLNCPVIEQLKVGREMRDFYFGENITDSDVLQLTKFYALNMFVYGIHLWMKISARVNKNPFYFYKFTCKSERNLLAVLFGLMDVIGNKPVVCHGDDLAYLFPIKIMGQNVDPESRAFKMIDNVTKLWTNFAKFGNPTPDDSLSVSWPRYTPQQQRYLDIGEQLVLGAAPDREEVEFWEKLFRQHLPQLAP